MNLRRVNRAAFIAFIITAVSIPLAITAQRASAATTVSREPAVTAACDYWTSNLGAHYVEADHARNLVWWSQGSGGRVRLEQKSPTSLQDCFRTLGGFGNNEIELQLASSALCLNVAGNSHAVGAHLILWPCNSAVNELFTAHPAGVGDVSIDLQSASSGLCVDLSAGINAGSTLVQKGCSNASPNGDPFQAWYLG